MLCLQVIGQHVELAGDDPEYVERDDVGVPVTTFPTRMRHKAQGVLTFEHVTYCTNSPAAARKGRSLGPIHARKCEGLVRSSANVSWYP
jgi:hypothetical protein